MTVILSWNIQYGKGCDGVVDLGRIRRDILAAGQPDVICLQEVADGFAELDGAGADQAAQIAGMFAEYQAVFAPGVDRYDGRRRRFGNMILSRLPLLDSEAHLLPRPADGATRHMRRVALAVTVVTAAGPLRIATSHLEYFAAGQRHAQVGRIRDLSAEWLANAQMPPQPARHTYAPLPPAMDLVWCGDFNLEPNDPDYAALQADLPAGAGQFRSGRLQDAWHLLHGTLPHAPTCGVHDAAQWPQGPHARDFFFVTPGLRTRLKSVETDTQTAASDHQPIRLLLAD